MCSSDLLPGGVKHFAAVNDRYHLGTGSKHALGLAFDTSLSDPSKSAEAAEAIRNRLRGAGLSDQAFKVIDEYRNPSSRSTGGHLHTQFNSREAAEQYAQSMGVKPTPAELAKEAPLPPRRPMELGGRPPSLEEGGTGFRSGGGGNPGQVVNNITINGANRPNAELAGQVQEHVSNAWSFRAHDMEPELT